MQHEYSVPAATMEALRGLGYAPDTSMQGDVQEWWDWFTAETDFYHGRRNMGNGVVMEYKRLTIHPARRVCREWASLLLNDQTTLAAESDAGNELLQSWLHASRLVQRGQGMVERAFALGTGAWGLSFDVDEGEVAAVRPRRYDARMILPLSWDEDECSECAFASRTYVRGKPIDQLQMHVLDAETGTYHVRTMLFDRDGKSIDPEAVGMLADHDTKSERPTFALVRPGIENVRADGSAMGQSVFADAVGAIQAVDNAFDSISREIDATKAKTFMADQLFDVVTDSDGTKVRPMSPDDSIIRVTSVDGDLIQTYAPSMRIDSLRQALGTSLEELGDLCGFGPQYFALDRTGGLKTATEVSADNSALMRNVRKHEHQLGGAMESLCEVVLGCMGFGGEHVRVSFDDSIISDTATEKAQAMSEVSAGLMAPWEYRMRFFGEDEATARERASEASTGAVALDLALGDVERDLTRAL